jgi:2'-hydroxyisoflavone reductase
MDLLILGGTVFLGLHMVEAALARGHRVTLFNRGTRTPIFSGDVEQIHGDRDGGLSALAGRRWDAAIDTSGYIPRIVRASAAMLSNSAGHYTFISSVSVYADMSMPAIDEDGAVAVLTDASTEEITGETYGALKALCEQEVLATLSGRALIIRPGLIVGPHDPTDRFSYWPARIARGGEVLAPGRAERPLQMIDVRDLAAWGIAMVEAGATGIYNATSPAHALTFGMLLEACTTVSRSDAAIRWVDEQFLLDAGVAPWSELPLWIPELDPSFAGFELVSSARASAAGLRCRPIAATVADTLDWLAARPADHEWRAGLSAAREAELLAAWRAHSEGKQSK